MQKQRLNHKKRVILNKLLKKDQEDIISYQDFLYIPHAMSEVINGHDVWGSWQTKKYYVAVNPEDPESDYYVFNSKDEIRDKL